MNTIEYKGLSWNHPRGYNALFSASELFNKQQAQPISLSWQVQSLKGFESAPIGQLAAAYDLLVLDHPHIGEAVKLECLHPLEDFFSNAQIAQWKAQSIGLAMESYFWEGRHWALPLDVASQVLAYRSDLLPDNETSSNSSNMYLPTKWQDVICLSEKVPVALSLGGPHAILNLYSICSAFGYDLNESVTDDFFHGDEPTQALEIMHQIYQRIPSGSEKLNPIELLEAMASTNNISLIPLIFGYVNYTKAGSDRAQVLFHDAPTTGSSGKPGSVLGGTGIAICKGCTPNQELLNHLIWLMDEQTQTEFITTHDGQPSARNAWKDTEVNNQWGNFYSKTLNTAENAIIRPRYNHYIRFQTRASNIVKVALGTVEKPERTIEKINTEWRSSRKQN